MIKKINPIVTTNEKVEDKTVEPKGADTVEGFHTHEENMDSNPDNICTEHADTDCTRDPSAIRGNLTNIEEIIELLAVLPDFKYQKRMVGDIVIEISRVESYKGQETMSKTLCRKVFKEC